MAANWQQSAAPPAPALSAQRSTGQAVDWKPVGPKPEGADPTKRYQAWLRPTDWRIHEHRLGGMPTLVGAAFLDMICRWARTSLGWQQPSLSGTQFLSPASISGNEDLWLELRLRGDGDKREFVFGSRRATGHGKDAGFTEHVRGTVANASGEFPATREIADIGARLHPQGPLPWLDPRDADGPLQCSARWETLADVFHRDEESLARLVLAPRFHEADTDWLLHPALLDVATSFALRFAASELFLPLQYGRLVAFGPLPNEFYSHARIRSVGSSEIIKLDVSLLNTAGVEIVRINDYILKRVPRTFRLPSAWESLPPAPPVATDITVAEGVEAFSRCLDAASLRQIVIATRDLEQLLVETRPTPPVSMQDKDRARGAETALHERPELATAFQEPSSELEVAIAEIWQSVLGISRIGLADNFMELGGNSLLAIQIISRTSATFEVEIPFDAFYHRPTVSGMADTIADQIATLVDDSELQALIAEIEAQAPPGETDPIVQ